MSSTVDYKGQPRYVCGRLAYPSPPEPGTIVGPNDTKEFLVILTGDGHVGYATLDDINEARDRVIAGWPARSPVELQLLRVGVR